ncbi:hypothetical protein ACTJIJ_18325 [Niabella sp. 22666]|uniref:hypothetical protein n=1 Tax=Niabella sp. 22666 TaxID=3453954 RepID=UPI003F86255B
MDYLLSALGIILIIWSITLIAGAIFLFAFLKERFDSEMILTDADDEKFPFKQELA